MNDKVTPIGKKKKIMKGKLLLVLTLEMPDITKDQMRAACKDVGRLYEENDPLMKCVEIKVDDEIETKSDPVIFIP